MFVDLWWMGIPPKLWFSKTIGIFHSLLFLSFFARFLVFHPVWGLGLNRSFWIWGLTRWTAIGDGCEVVCALCMHLYLYLQLHTCIDLVLAIYDSCLPPILLRILYREFSVTTTTVDLCKLQLLPISKDYKLSSLLPTRYKLNLSAFIRSLSSSTWSQICFNSDVAFLIVNTSF